MSNDLHHIESRGIRCLTIYCIALDTRSFSDLLMAKCQIRWVDAGFLLGRILMPRHDNAGVAH